MQFQLQVFNFFYISESALPCFCFNNWVIIISTFVITKPRILWHKYSFRHRWQNLITINIHKTLQAFCIPRGCTRMLDHSPRVRYTRRLCSSRRAAERKGRVGEELLRWEETGCLTYWLHGRTLNNAVPLWVTEAHPRGTCSSFPASCCHLCTHSVTGMNPSPAVVMRHSHAVVLMERQSVFLSNGATFKSLFISAVSFMH